MEVIVPVPNSKPSILMISLSDSAGGAARAAFRLFECLSEVDSKVSLLVAHKTINNNRIIKLNQITNLKRALFSRIDILLCKIFDPYSLGWKTGFYLGALKAKRLDKLNFDILNLHWIGHGMISIKELKKIKKTILLSLQDEWIINEFSHFKDHNTKNIYSKFSLRKVIANNRIKNKKEFLFKPNVFVVTLNSEVASKITELYPEIQNKIYILRNAIDINKFRPTDKPVALVHKDLLPNKPFILYLGGFKESRKGWDLLSNSLRLSSANLDLVVIGDGFKGNLGVNSQIQIINLLKIQDLDFLSLLYSNALAVIVPSRDEGLSLVATEALSCGTPVVGFLIQGLRDIIINGKTGFLVPKFDFIALNKCIETMSLADREYYKQQCREFAILNFSYPVIRKQFDEIVSKVSNQLL